MEYRKNTYEKLKITPDNLSSISIVSDELGELLDIMDKEELNYISIKNEFFSSREIERSYELLNLLFCYQEAIGRKIIKVKTNH